MTSLYHLNEELRQYPFLKYRYDEKQVTFYSLMGIEPEENCHFLSTAHEVITNWSKICEELFTQEMPESNLPCWQGHYEQFGLVMFNLANMCRARKTHEGTWTSFLDALLPPEKLHNLILRGYKNFDDKIFIEAWLSLIGHPDFLKHTITCIENTELKITELQLLTSFNDLNYYFWNKEKIKPTQ